MGIRYKFVGIELVGNKPHACFKKGCSGVLGLFTRSHQVAVSGKGCKELYKEACENPDDSLGSYASPNSKEDALRGFNAIRAYSEQNGIPFEEDGLA
jgi:hypothetical protein